MISVLRKMRILGQNTQKSVKNRAFSGLLQNRNDNCNMYKWLIYSLLEENFTLPLQLQLYFLIQFASSLSYLNLILIYILYIIYYI